MFHSFYFFGLSYITISLMLWLFSVNCRTSRIFFRIFMVYNTAGKPSLQYLCEIKYRALNRRIVKLKNFNLNVIILRSCKLIQFAQAEKKEETVLSKNLSLFLNYKNINKNSKMKDLHIYEKRSISQNIFDKLKS